MIGRIAFLCCLLLGAAVTPAQAQVAGSMRLQRIVSALHTPELRASPGKTLSVTPLLDLHAIVRGRETNIRQQLRLPITSRADLTLTGRVGRFGPSSQVRFRLRF